MAKPVTNRAASVKDRLLALAREQGRVFDVVLIRYALERLLCRLSVSSKRHEFVLKGGMLVSIWLENANRETRDIDFLGHGDAQEATLKETFREIMSIAMDDGLAFDLDAIESSPIREDAEYAGVRLKTSAFLERTRIPVTIDIGFGDAVQPEARQVEYPSLLGMENPSIVTYPPALVIAEKFQAMVALGAINSRMKDYFDIWAISQSMEIADADLDAAIDATFGRRKTEVPTDRPPGLSASFIGDATKQAQWRAYARTILLNEIRLEEIVDAIWKLVAPSCARLLASRK